MDGYSLITSVRVDLRGRAPFPIALYAGDPALIEAEIQQLASAILTPGYLTKTRSSERLPYISLLEVRPEEQIEQGRYKIAEEDVWTRKELPVASECRLSVRHSAAGISLEFHDAQRQMLRRALLDTDALSQAIGEYRKMVAQCEVLIEQGYSTLAKLVPSFDRSASLKLEQSDVPEVFKAKYKIVQAEHFRRDTHNVGSAFISWGLLEQGISLRNPTLTQDIEMRVFELLSYLMSDPQSVAAYQPATPLSHRQPWQFRDVLVKKTDVAP